MAVDTPAMIAVLGAGPIGLEAALYARFLGYDVRIYERGFVAEHVRRWGHVRMFTPFHMNRSTLGLAALTAQHENFEAPQDEALLTGHEWADRYLLPLAQTDLLIDHLQQHTEVCFIGREGCLKEDLIGDEDRGELPFRILVRDSDGRERVDAAEVIIDATGMYGCPNWMGIGGIPALGEAALRHQIAYQIPDVLGSQRGHYADRRILLVGSGYSAATTAVALAELARECPKTEVVWISRQSHEDSESGPIAPIPDDRWRERSALVQAANACAREQRSMTYYSGTGVQRVDFEPATERFTVQFHGAHESTEVFDRIVAHVGYRPEHRLAEELQLHFCYATDGPIKLAASLGGHPSPDRVEQSAPEHHMLVHPEPNFYTLGAKSYGRNSPFLYATGLQQIRQIFAIIGDRAELDLYSSVTNLLP